ncbi:SDR family oxidoreductase [Pseudohoeflea coraliihabitans]|uniref:SDR family oxidoreductase n=1 Tax=Pseudohoeflea coraliihabitans TaxID=2860393 RepID=A0ABS6WNH4_9HYPH|nr:SDR family oxidoreductase [Pseudohoeflea sp. DP4N28-3]MBW3097506.1 SDR family oxidoreductase [Pseudohoeflea sp. DP4N28-3]
MDLGLKEKGALVLSSSRGLGLGIARALAAEGANVVLCGRDAARLETETDAINGLGGGRARFITADLAEAATPGRLFEEARAMLGHIDILVNNTGGPPPGAMSDAGVDAVRSNYEVMVLRLIELTGLVLPAMREKGWGRVLTVASSGVIEPIANLGLSNAIRASLVGWSKSMANEVARDGVTFNMLLPGQIDTDRLRQLLAMRAENSGQDADSVARSGQAAIPVGRYGTPEEFGAVAAFLVSEKASYINGSQIRCDGGAIRSV